VLRTLGERTIESVPRHGEVSVRSGDGRGHHQTLCYSGVTTVTSKSHTFPSH
jgi:hypothetical protein